MGEYKMYHVFSCFKDSSFDKYEEALQYFNKCKDDGETRLRLYEDSYTDIDDQNPEEDCLLALGDFPS